MQKILNFVKSVNSHPTAGTVFKFVKKSVPSITLATVYRNLNKLVEQKQLLRLEINGEFRFDAETGFHQHGVCRTCGVVVDFFDEKLSKDVFKKFDFGEFEADLVSIKFYGLCKNCRRKLK